MIFKVQDSFFQNIPNAVFGIIVVKNFDNTKNYEFINKLFTQNLESSKENSKMLKLKKSPAFFHIEMHSLN